MPDRWCVSYGLGMAIGPSSVPDPATTGAGGASPGAGVSTSDWPAQAADAIERTVGAVRDRTTGPAITVARALVFGTFSLFVGVLVVVLTAIAAVRVLDAYLPDAVVGEQHTWAAHLVVGLVFSLVGMVLWRQRTRRPGAE